MIGVADERWGEVGRAFVVVKPGRVLDPAALASHCAARIARYKVPKEFLAMEALPRTASGKIQKHLLRSTRLRRPLVMAIRPRSSACGM